MFVHEEPAIGASQPPASLPHSSPPYGIEWRAEQGQQERKPAQLLPRPLAGEGFSQWLRAQRAKSDTFGFCLSLLFHSVTLSKYQTLPASHIVYYSIYTAATLCLLAWQRSGRPSYAAWRDWVQAAIRLDVFLSPARIAIWEHSVDLPPPILPGPPILTTLAALLLAVSNTLTVHLRVLPFAHSLGLWPHALVQLVCAGRVAVGAFNRRLCRQTMFRHPATQGALEETYQWMQMLTLFSFAPFAAHSAGARPVAEQHCHAVVGWLEVFLGFGVSVAAQACLDARMYRAYLSHHHHHQQQQQGQDAELQGSSASKRADIYDRAFDVVSRRLLLGMASACQNIYLWLLAAVAISEVLSIVLG